MKFKTVKGATYRRLDIANKDGETLRIETKDEAYSKPGVYVEVIIGERNYTTDLSRSKALKLAWAIINELDERTRLVPISPPQAC